MGQLNAVITGITAKVPDYILTNDELATIVNTSDEWIMTRVGIKERRILKGEQQGISALGTPAVKELLEKTNTAPEEVDAVIFATSTPDHFFPSAASIVAKIMVSKMLSALIWKSPVQDLCMDWRFAMVSSRQVSTKRSFCWLVIKCRLLPIIVTVPPVLFSVMQWERS